MADEGRGRPLRAMGLILGGWVAMRVVVTVWPDAPLPRALVPPIEVPVARAPVVSIPIPEPADPVDVAAGGPARVAMTRMRTPETGSAAVDGDQALPPPPAPPVASTPAARAPLATIALLALVRFGVPEPATDPSRWSGKYGGSFADAGRRALRRRSSAAVRRDFGSPMPSTMRAG